MDKRVSQILDNKNMIPCSSDNVDIDESSKDLLVVKDTEENKYVIKVTDHNQNELKIARSVQDRVADKYSIAPEPVFSKYFDDVTILCDSFVNGYDNILYEDYDSVDLDSVCFQMGKILGHLHSVDTQYYDKFSFADQVSDYYVDNINRFWNDLNKDRTLVSDTSLYKLRELSDFYRSVGSLDLSVVHLTDFTTTNVIFNKSITDCIAVDWEWVRKHSPIFGLVGVLYRLSRLYFIDVDQKNLWYSLIEGYKKTIRHNFNIPDFESEEVHKWMVLSTLNETSHFSGWTRWMSDEQKRRQSSHIENRIERLYDQI